MPFRALDEGELLLTDVNVRHRVVDPNDAAAFIQYLADGTIVWSGILPQAPEDPPPSSIWLLGGSPLLYELMMAPAIGAFSSGPIGWVAPGAGAIWTLTQTVIGATSFAGQIKVRRASDQVELTLAEITMLAQVLAS